MAKQTDKAPAAPQAAPATNPILAQAYTLDGAKAYNVRPNTAQDNAASWELIKACIAKNNGSATRAQLLEAVKDRNHAPMIGYCIRRGWIVPVPAAPAK